MQDNASNVIPARAEFSAQQAELAGRVARNTPAPGLNETCVPGLALIRADAPSEPLPSVYHPSLCVVVQGRKRALLGDGVFVYDPLNYLVVSMTLPITGQIIEATAQQPYLCLRIDIDPGVVAEDRKSTRLNSTPVLPIPGLNGPGVPGLALTRADAPSEPLPSVYHPSRGVVVQGRKRALLGDGVFVYDPLNYLVVSMTLPITGQIIEATAQQPYLCLRIDIDPGVVADLLAQLPAAVLPPEPASRALYLARTSAPLLDAVLRLARLPHPPGERSEAHPSALQS